jgi:hypothetical protein
MANEIKVTVRRSVANGTYKNEKNPGTVQIDQAAIGESGGIFNITTEGTGEQVVFTDITTEGWLYMQNHDTANYVVWGPYATANTAMEAIGRMEAGETVMLRMEPSASITLLANTATCDVEISVLED